MRMLTLIASFLSVTASAAELPPITPSVALTFGKDAAGYVPGAVVRPDGDGRVAGIPPAVSSFEIGLTLKLGRSTVEVRPFMLNTSLKNGPSVVGLRYEGRYAPVDCRETDAFAFDVPWKTPCFEVGAAHYSAHNADDATYGSVFTNALLARIRVASASFGRTSTWAEFDWYFGSLDSPFALTPTTDVAAGGLERKAWRAALSQRARIGDGDLDAGVEVLASDAGPASGGAHVGYLHRFTVAIGSGPHGFALTPALGAEAAYRRNFRKTGPLGADVASLRLFLSFPFGD